MDNKYVQTTKDKTEGVEHWLACLECQTETVHRVITSIDSEGEIPNSDFFYGWNEEHQVIQCQGCRSLSFRHESSNSEDYNQTSEDDWEINTKVELYPHRYMQRPQLPDVLYLPLKVRAIYQETRFVLLSKQLILAGIGIRALVESVCKNRKATGNLYNMIESLVKSGDLKRVEADILHKLRFMGNSSAHEAKPHDELDLIRAFDIAEHLLISVYLLEIRAAQLPDNK